LIRPFGKFSLTDKVRQLAIQKKAVIAKALFLNADTDELADASITTAVNMTTESICGMLGPSTIREPIQRAKHTNPPTSRVRSDTGCVISFSSSAPSVYHAANPAYAGPANSRN